MIKLENGHESINYNEVADVLANNLNLDRDTVSVDDSIITVTYPYVTVELNCDYPESSRVTVSEIVLNRIGSEDRLNRVISYIADITNIGNELSELVDELEHVLVVLSPDDYEDDFEESVSKNKVTEAVSESETKARKILSDRGDATIDSLKNYMKSYITDPDRFYGINIALDDGYEKEVDEFIDNFFDTYVYDKIIEEGIDYPYDEIELLSDLLDDYDSDIKELNDSYQDLIDARSDEYQKEIDYLNQYYNKSKIWWWYYDKIRKYESQWYYYTYRYYI